LTNNLLNRREAIAALSASTLTPFLSACSSNREAPAASAAAAAGTAAKSTPADATTLLDSIGENLLRLAPETATTLGLDKGDHAELRSRLADRSVAGQQKLAEQIRADLARAAAIDVAGLPHATRTSVEVVRSAYTTALEGFALPYGDVAVGGWRNTPYVVIQNVGAYLDVPRFLDAEHPIETAADAEAYLARLESYPKLLDGELGRLQEARKHGLVPPAFLLDKALKQIQLSAENARKGGPLVESIERRTKAKGIAGTWAERARTIAAQQVAPALDRQIAELQVQRAAATGDPGMWARPHGDDYYRWALKASTTTTMSPEEVHQLGLDELKALHGRMDPILKSAGYAQGSIGERMKALAKDKRYQFSEGDKGRAEILAFIQDRLRIIREQLPRAFNTLVRGNLEVKRLPPEEEPGAPGAYGGAGSIDGSIPGKYWINLRTTDLHSKYSLPDLTHHEAIPGHVWQGEYANKLALIRTLLAFNAYSEGWGLYAEQLADELGVFDDFPVGRLGYLQSIAFRACRLVVDTGLHAKRWTREQAVAYFVDVNGSNPEEVASEVDRYVPLDVLAKNVDEYIAAAKLS
jgi:uncharacterized protein (DUF885 family)